MGAGMIALAVGATGAQAADQQRHYPFLPELAGGQNYKCVSMVEKADRLGIRDKLIGILEKIKVRGLDESMTPEQICATVEQQTYEVPCADYLAGRGEDQLEHMTYYDKKHDLLGDRPRECKPEENLLVNRINPELGISGMCGQDFRQPEQQKPQSPATMRHELQPASPRPKIGDKTACPTILLPNQPPQFGSVAGVEPHGVGSLWFWLQEPYNQIGVCE